MNTLILSKNIKRKIFSYVRTGRTDETYVHMDGHIDSGDTACLLNENGGGIKIINNVVCYHFLNDTLSNG